MPFLKTIGFDNYRVFKNNSEFEFSPITLLTGANNSGKSSIFKALLLLQNSSLKNSIFEYLNFKGNNHFLGYFENVLNDQTKPLKFTLPFNFLNQDNFLIQLEFHKTNNRSKNYNCILRDLRIFEKGMNYDFFYIKYLPIKPIQENDDYYESVFHKLEFYLDIKKYKNLLLEYTNFSNSYFPPDDNDYNNEVNVVDENQPTIQDTFDQRVLKGKISLKDIVNPFFAKSQEIKDITSYLFDLTNNIHEFLDITGNDLAYHEQCEAEFKDNTLGLIDYFFSVKSAFETEPTLSDPLKSKIFLMKKYFKNHLNQGFVSINKILRENLSHLSSVRGNLERLYFSEGNTFNELISEFTEIFEPPIGYSTARNFIDEWLSRFEIGEMKYLQIVSSPEYNFNTVFLKKDLQDKDRKVLIDLGFGVSQLIAILIKIAIESKKNSDKSNIILIEEPEANLHPKYQSLLADMFIDASFRFNTQFILETHSEYLIRRFQYWIAQGHIDKTDISIYNLDMTKNSERISKITFDKIGKIKQTLGKKFFDELTTLKDEIEKTQELNYLKKEKINLEKQLIKIKGNAKLLLLTEDEDFKLLRLVFLSSGFIESDIEFFPYKGCTQKNVVKTLIKFIEKHFQDLKIIVHRDRDYLTDIEIDNWKKEISLSNKVIPFVTHGTMIESYFINCNHLCRVNKKITPELAVSFIEHAIGETKNYSVEQIKIQAFGEKYKDKPTHIDEIYYSNLFDSKRERYFHGKKVYESLNGIIQKQLKINSKINQISEYIKVDELEQIRNKLIEST